MKTQARNLSAIGMLLCLFCAPAVLEAAFPAGDDLGKPGQQDATPSFVEEIKRDLQLGKMDPKVSRPKWVLPGSLLATAVPVDSSAANEQQQAQQPFAAAVPGEDPSSGAVWQLLVLIASLIFAAYAYWRYRKVGSAELS